MTKAKKQIGSQIWVDGTRLIWLGVFPMRECFFLRFILVKGGNDFVFFFLEWGNGSREFLDLF